MKKKQPLSLRKAVTLIEEIVTALYENGEHGNMVDKIREAENKLYYELANRAYGTVLAFTGSKDLAEKVWANVRAGRNGMGYGVNDDGSFEEIKTRKWWSKEMKEIRVDDLQEDLHDLSGRSTMLTHRLSKFHWVKKK